MPKYPNVTIKLSDGNNAISNLGNITRAMSVARAMKAGKVSQEEVNAYLKKAMYGDFDNLLKVTMEMVNVVKDKE